jgi:hypothetical protein
MPREPQSKYFWPSSGLSESDMALLYRARETLPVRQPITQLLAQAVRETYGHLADMADTQFTQEQLKKAA